MKTYKYSSLPPRDIRLLHLHAGSRVDELTAELIPLPLAAAATLEFSAISYAWGDPLPRKRIICSGGVIEIGSSLYDALINIRSRQGGYLIWADALCINQNNAHERASQVRLMDEIYSAATRTVIWLGTEMDSVVRAFEFLRKFDLVYSRKSQSSHIDDIETSHTNDIELLSAVFAPNFLSAAHDMGALLQQSWFSRKWILQELAKSRDPILVTGRKRLHWRFLVSWLDYLQSHPRAFWLFEGAYPRQAYVSSKGESKLQPPMCYQRACILASLGDSQKSLCELLNTTFIFDCSDSRDHIIALLGLASDVRTSELNLFVDYTIPDTELCRRLARFCIRDSRSLTILWSFINCISPNDQVVLPSWIPYIKQASRNISAVGYRLGVSDCSVLHAAADSSLQAYVGEQAGHLKIQGRIVDVINSIGVLPDMDPTISYEGLGSARYVREWAKGIHTWLDDCESVTRIGSDSTFSAHDGDKKLISAILIHFSSELWQEASKSFQQYRASNRAIYEASPATDLREEIENMNSIPLSQDIQNILIENMCRRFGASRKGAAGWMPKCAAVGDLICFFDGMSLPYVLRPGNGGRYKLVGEGYVAGLEASEAIGYTGSEVRHIILE